MPIAEHKSGVYAIAVTPFTPDGHVDWGSVESMTKFYVGCGAEGITILGVMGEAPKLELNESLAIAERVILASAPRPVIVGVSAPGFASMRALAHGAMKLGASGVMIAPPPHLRTDDQIVGYYDEAVAALGPDVPFVIQDYPLVLSVVMTPKVISRIVMNHPSAMMLKHEDWPGLEKISTLRRFEAEGTMRKLPIFTGNGALFLDFEMDRGADGAMTGYAFPDMLAALVRLVRDGKRDAAHDLFDAHLPLIRYEQQPGVGLAVRKYVLMKRGAIRSDAQRKPGSTLSPAARAEVDYLLARLARHDPRARIG
jgi:4-hydroxy-tetrahydrodipicolinate synthase